MARAVAAARARRRRPGERQVNLRARLLLGAVTPLVVAAIAQTGYNVVAQRRAMMSGLEDKAHAVTTLLVNVVAPSLTLGDSAGVREGLGSIAKGDELVFALVADADGKTIAYRGQTADRPLHEAAIARRLGVWSDAALTTAVAPIQRGGRTVARVAVGLSTATVTHHVSQTVLRAALISAGGGACAIIVVLMLAQEVVRRNRDMRLLLASVDQGFLTIYPDGKLAPERSRIVDRWLGRWLPGLTFWEYIDPIDADAAAWFQIGWASLVADALPLELAIDQLPKHIRRGEKTLQIEYKPLMKGHALDKVLIVLSDVTVRLERERVEADQRELLAVSEKIALDRRGFIEFAGDAEKLVAALESGAVGGDDARRMVHTLKGNAALFGVNRVVTTCHEVETAIEADGAVDAAGLRRCAEAWRDARSRFAFLIGVSDANSIRLSEDDYRDLKEAVARQAPYSDLEQRLLALTLEPTRPRLLRFGEQARAIAQRLGKGEIFVNIEDHGVRLESERWAPFWSSFTHMVRNAVDHGLETPEARQAAGKSQIGTLWLRSREERQRLIIEIADDGGGIDWTRLAQKARERHLPAETREDLVEALFADGISTREEASEYSGRGVGLAAVRAACRELHGELAIESTPGRGTTFRFWWPLADRAPSEQAVPLKQAAN